MKPLFLELIVILILSFTLIGSNQSSAQVLTRFGLQTGTALHETDPTFDFVAADWNRDNAVDIIAIKKSNTGSQTTEVHVLDGASRFQRWLLQTGTALHETDPTFDFVAADWNRDNAVDIIAIKKSNTGTQRTEVHIIALPSPQQQMPPQFDPDNDRLPNGWEQKGIDWNGDRRIDLNLSEYGANPLQKDIFVEVDFMQLHRPHPQAITHLVAAFARAPLPNPDDSTGVNLHVILDEQIQHQPTTSLDDQAIKNRFFGTAAERISISGTATINAKLSIFHYGLFVHEQPGTTSSGIGRTPGMDFIVSLGSAGWGDSNLDGHPDGSIDQQEGTFIHELGHNMGLNHGGSDTVNCKPNYLSVMSYAFQFANLIAIRPLDYSRSLLDQLNEGSLNENDGVMASTPPGLNTITGPPPLVLTQTGIPIDWNRDGDTTDNPVNSDINNIIPSCVASAGEILSSHEDWNRLTYRVGSGTLAVFGAQPPVEPQPPHPDLTVQDVRQMRVLLLEGINEVISSLPNTSFKQPAIGSKNFLINETETQTSTIATLLYSDRLDQAIAELSALRSKADSSVGGNITDDLISNPDAQQELLPLIDNLILTLQKQK